MSLSAALAVFVLTASMFLLAFAVFAGRDTVRARTVANLRRGMDDGFASQVDLTGVDDDDSRSRLYEVARRLTPVGTIRRLEKLSIRAGRPRGWSIQRLVVAKIVVPLIVVLLGLALLRTNPEPLLLLLTLGTAVVCYFLPELLLQSRGQERNDEIALELADTLDQMTIAVEAGLGFDAAMARAGRNGTGPLAQELIRTLQEIQVGQLRRTAYEQLALRTDVPDLRRFIRAIIQADAYGISVADVLRTQASEMRLKRRQRAEEKAQQVPVKVIFPLLVCILPVLFIVLLGPTVINMMEAFS
ncbi:secretion system protein [Dietzia sp. HMSC21D01]|uniref:Type II secretion system F family protein n=1 Tax=Dietzia cinnamea TaxID=321318 RepID=A0AAW5Q873_9ACTN|nr:MULTISPECIES: type II secretion system F family protein [Dietzia]MCT1864217.1 type II secretion system F family protein [Dietzia cinnamea]MCT2029257.1 type II secretion system F family protein [Dietzia cinnamea]MCT2032696.1 type II secretion system F family protein [Dietzia cinnamea]MCT2076389.1 type II secretion system F family protein [Dietzia cinnamea]MCT2106929.1 type II secretion system F family protein [Dietzia cinnamea]